MTIKSWDWEDEGVEAARDNLWAEIPPLDRDEGVTRAITAYRDAVAIAVVSTIVKASDKATPTYSAAAANDAARLILDELRRAVQK